mgnify:CR=1 FL=1
MIGSSSLYSLVSWMNCLTSAMTSGSVSFCPVSSYLSFRPSRRFSMLLSAISVYFGCKDTKKAEEFKTESQEIR